MTDLPWLRLYTDTVDNEKIRLLAFEDRWHYIALLCLKQQGILDENNQLLDRKIAVKLGLQIEALDEVKRRLIEVELIQDDWQPIGWGKHQFLSDNSTNRVRKYRENKKKQECNVSGTLLKQKCNAIDSDTESDTDTDKIKTSCERKRPPPVPFDEIINIYHEKLPNNPKVVGLTANRKAQIKARWNNQMPSLDQWENYFEDVSNNKFLTGRSNPGIGRSKPFIATIDFLIKEANVFKIAEGNYND